MTRKGTAYIFEVGAANSKYPTITTMQSNIFRNVVPITCWRNKFLSALNAARCDKKNINALKRTNPIKLE